jgi:hypothetical protein
VLGGRISDLQTGDVFEPVTYTVTGAMTGEYAHGVEEDLDWFLCDANPWGRQVRMPTMIHSDKMRLLEANCPGEQRIKAMSNPDATSDTDARIHVEYHAKNHAPAFVGDTVTVSGRIKERYTKKGRDYLEYALEVRAVDGRLITTYQDHTLLRYRKEGE